MNANLQTMQPVSPMRHLQHQQQSTLQSTSATNTAITGYKHILLRKLSKAVICSVVSQLIILFWYIFVINFSLFSPLDSITRYFATFTSFSTWIYVFMFSAIIFAQSIICAKDYIITPRYCSTRFSKLKAIFSLHNVILLNLHVFVGLFSIWLFLGFTSFRLFDSEPGNNKKQEVKVVENTLYLLYFGAWTGLYYFVSVYTSEKKVLFPVIQQLKWLQFKANLLPLLNKSKSASFWPTLYFLIIYALFGRSLNDYLPLTIQESSSDSRVYFFAWGFAMLIYFSLNLMNFYYGLFLTEPFEFPIVKTSESDQVFSLKDALETNVPIIRHLACQDIFLLAGNSRVRREILYQLSNPGNHPHNWNNLIEIMLRIVKEYTDCLNSSLNNILMPHANVDQVKPATTPPKQEYINQKVRRIGIMSPECVVSLKSNTQTPSMITYNPLASLKEKTAVLKDKLGINFMFKELPEASIQKCLGEGQIIFWLVQAMSCLAASSLSEDRYGIVQKDLPLIINALVELKSSVEKLNRLPALTRKGLIEDYNCRMKLAIMNAVKRSIYNIVNDFGPYLKDLNVKNEVFLQLQGFALYNSM